MSNALKTYEAIYGLIGGDEMYVLIQSLRKCAPELSASLKREHQKNYRRLRRKLNAVPHALEQEVKALVKKNGYHGAKIECCKLLKNDGALNLREALWFYDYIAQGILPWFLER